MGNLTRQVTDRGVGQAAVSATLARWPVGLGVRGVFESRRRVHSLAWCGIMRWDWSKSVAYNLANALGKAGE